jgi:hypothetical protein
MRIKELKKKYYMKQKSGHSSTIDGKSNSLLESSASDQIEISQDTPKKRKEPSPGFITEMTANQNVHIPSITYRLVSQYLLIYST